MAALAAALPRARPLVAVVSILDDKDAAAMLAALLPPLRALRLHGRANPRALPPATLASLAGAARRRGRGRARAAHARSRAPARSPGPDGAVVATGSIYLVADLLVSAGRRRASAL